MNEITINGEIYIKKSEIINNELSEDFVEMPYKIVRTYSAGVFAGYIKEIKGQEVIMKKARRLWYWEGAASLSQLAEEGTSMPEGCKFPCEVSEIHLLNAIEILTVSKKAKNSIEKVKIWEL